MTMTSADTEDRPAIDRIQQNTNCDDLETVSSFQQILLFTLADNGPSSGQDVLTKAHSDYTVSEVNHGRLYPNLDALVELGLINRGQFDRRTNKYTITPQGIEYLRILADEAAKAHKAAINNFNTDSE